MKAVKAHRQSAAISRVRIRACRAGDIAAVLELWKRAGSTPSPTDDPVAIRTRLKRDRRLFLVARDGPRIVGCLMGGWDGWRASVARLAVDPDYRRLGLARVLVQRVEQRLRALGARRISGLVLASNRSGRAFWSQAGYEREPGITRYIKDLTRQGSKAVSP